MQTVSIGLVGYGTIGQGVGRLFFEGAEGLARRTGMRFDLKYIVDQDLDRPRDVEPPPGRLTLPLPSIWPGNGGA